MAEPYGIGDASLSPAFISWDTKLTMDGNLDHATAAAFATALAAAAAELLEIEAAR